MTKFYLFGGVLLFAVICFQPARINAQTHDYMTDQESDVVREAQQIDDRILVLTKMIDRRFRVLDGAVIEPKKAEKEKELFGELGSTKRFDLIFDINRLLQKAVDDIDNAADHNQLDAKFFPKAMRKLTESSQSYLNLLKTEIDKTEDEKEKGLLLGSIEFCNEIIEASAKVPPEPTKEEKKKSDHKDS